MIILYTDIEGGHWKPFNTPLKTYDITRVVEAAASGIRDRPAIFGGEPCDLFYPDGDTLPIFHSILLSDGNRWDAVNQRWHQFQFPTGPLFREWWDKYIARYRPFEPDDEREYWWSDQGHPSAEDLAKWGGAL